MKNIKDYLHLYIGCQYWVCSNNSIDPVIQELTPQFLNEIEEYGIQGKPVLLQLSDMNIDNLIELFDLSDTAEIVNVTKKDDSIKWNYKWFNPNGENKDDGYSHSHIAIDLKNLVLPVEKFSYLLKMGYDLFNLINDGIAIHKHNPVLRYDNFVGVALR